MKRDILILSALCTCCNLFAEEITVKHLRYAGPYEIKGPFIVDSLDVNSKKFTDAELLKTAIPFNNVRESNRTLDAATTAGQSRNSSVSLASFYLNSDRYTDGTLQISGPGHYEVYIDNEKQTPANGELKLTLEPRRYEVVIKYLTAPDETNHIPKVTFKTDSKAVVTATTDPEKRYTLSDVFDGTRFRSVSLSPNGKYLLTAYQTTYPGGDTESFQQVTDRATGQVLMESNNHHYSWMPRSNRLYYTRKGMQGKELVTIDPATQAEEVLAHNLPDGWFNFAPTEDFLLFNITEEGPKKGEDLQEILVPDDRQPGWRTRSFIHKYDLATGVFQRLTYGHTSTSINDISDDGRYLLFTCSERELTKRPFSTTLLYRMDLQTLETELLLKDPFISYAQFSPDGKMLAIAASGEAFNKIGLKIAPGQTSNMADGQLFLYDPASKQANPVTKDFNPSVQNFVWNKGDKQIYLQGEDKDCVRLYVLNPSTGKIATPLLHQPEKEYLRLPERPLCRYSERRHPRRSARLEFPGSCRRHDLRSLLPAAPFRSQQEISADRELLRGNQSNGTFTRKPVSVACICGIGLHRLYHPAQRGNRLRPGVLRPPRECMGTAYGRRDHRRNKEILCRTQLCRR